MSENRDKFSRLRRGYGQHVLAFEGWRGSNALASVVKKRPSLGNICIFSEKRTYKICRVCNVAEYQNRWQGSRYTTALVRITPTFSPLQRRWSFPDIVWGLKDRP